MKTFDEIQAMPEQDRKEYLDNYLHEQLEVIYSQCNPNKVLELRAFQARLNKQLSQYGNNHYVRAQVSNMVMMEKLLELNNRYKELGL